MLDEQWKSIAGYPTYEVSNYGHVRRLKNDIAAQLSPYRHSGGYLCITLYGNGPRKRYPVHRLVVEAFLGPIPEGREVNHIDGIKTNARLDNLEIVTRRENLRHAFDVLHVPRARGEKQALAKLKAEDIPVILQMYKDGSRQKDIAEQLQVDTATINHVLRGRTWRHLSIPLGLESLPQDGHHRGSQTPGAKLTEADIPLIRSMASSGTKYPIIARQFHVSVGSIHLIVTRQRWAHIP